MAVLTPKWVSCKAFRIKQGCSPRGIKRCSYYFYSYWTVAIRSDATQVVIYQRQLGAIHSYLISHALYRRVRLQVGNTQRMFPNPKAACTSNERYTNASPTIRLQSVCKLAVTFNDLLIYINPSCSGTIQTKHVANLSHHESFHQHSRKTRHRICDAIGLAVCNGCGCCKCLLNRDAWTKRSKL